MAGTAVPDDTTVCDDFECTSSPAVGVAIKAIAQQVDGPVREGCSGAAWAAGIELVDKGAAGARICTRERVDKYEPLKEALAEGATGEVLSMDMDGMDTLLLRWRLRGTPQLAALGDIDAVVTWKVTFNLISGRATQLEISYDYGETPKPAALYFTAQRTLAAAPLRGDPSEDASKEEDSGINVNPADPGRWMQQQNQEDQFQKEAIDLALALAVLYALVQALKTVL
eukprot:PRCOL_00007103-RA